jgi:hypothetical protein
LYGAMASGRPILFVGPGRCETADAIHEARCGIVIDPSTGGDQVAGKQLAEVIRSWADVRAAAEELGARGRCAFLEQYDHRLSCAAFERVVRSTWGRRSDVTRETQPPRRARSHTARSRSGSRRAASDPPASMH